MGATARLEGVTRTFGRTTALRSTDLVLQPGVVGLLGPNGAGKTTMLRLLATSLPPTTGRIEVAGFDVTAGLAERTEARRRLGYLPQEVTFPRGMTSSGFLDYVAVLKEWRSRESRHREVQRVLDLVGLGDRAAKRISALSGGQRRRLAVAQALLGDPELVILDEPTTGLDPEQRASLRATLSALPGTVLLATHQTEDVAALCDRVLVMDEGALQFDGLVSDLVEIARGRVHVGPEAGPDALSSYRTGSGSIRSVGGRLGPDAVPVEPTVEDAYLLLRAAPTRIEGARP
jgi:ABC-2 type transport system ATP-binding protein